MTRDDWMADRSDLLVEIQAIARELERIERQFGACAAAEDVRRRLDAVRATVGAQMLTALHDNRAVH